MAIGKEYFGGRQDPDIVGKNLGVYGENQIVIMIFYGIWGMSMSHKGFFGNHKRWILLLSIRHVLWVKFYICILCFCKVNFGALLMHRAYYPSVKDL